MVQAAIREVDADITWIMSDEEKPGSGLYGDIYIMNMTTLIRPFTATGSFIDYVTCIPFPVNILYTLYNIYYICMLFNVNRFRQQKLKIHPL